MESGVILWVVGIQRIGQKKENKMAFIIIILYFLPTVIGFKKKNVDGIFLLNLLLGWTYLGWVIALIWAVIDEKRK